MFFGIRPRNDLMHTFLSQLSISETENYHKKYESIMRDYEKEMEKEFKETLEKTKLTKDKLKIGDIVTIRSPDSLHSIGRGNANYLAEIYELVRLGNQRAIVTPLFHKTRKCPQVHISHLRKFPQEELLQLFPIGQNFVSRCIM